MAEYNCTGDIQPTYCVCVHRDHKGLADARAAHGKGTTNLRRHLKDNHGIEAKSGLAAVASSDTTRAHVGAHQQDITHFFGAAPAPYLSQHPNQLKFYEAQLDMVISSLSPESIVDDSAYMSMIAAANPRLRTLSSGGSRERGNFSPAFSVGAGLQAMGLGQAEGHVCLVEDVGRAGHPCTAAGTCVGQAGRAGRACQKVWPHWAVREVQLQLAGRAGRARRGRQPAGAP